MKSFLFSTFLLAILSVGAMSAEAANLYVRAGATGSNNGADWTNAFTRLPSSLVRGNTYYIADGTYPSQTFNTANSSTTLITIKKATVADHGTETGWVSTYGDGQATWGKWFVTTDYWLFDGQTRNADWKTGGVSQYGFYVTSSNGAMRLDDGNYTAGADNVTFRYIDFKAGGQHTGTGDDTIYGIMGNSNITFERCALRDSDRTIFLMRGAWQNLLVEYSYLARNSSTAAIHGELLSDTGSDNLIFRYNIIEDIEGTGVWAVLNGSGSKTAANTATGWKIYGNVINWTSGSGGVAAILYSANDASNKNWTDNLVFYNNTVHGPNVSYYGLYIEAGSNNVAKNNIFYDAKASAHVGASASYNWYYLTSHNGDSASSTQTCTSNCTIFTNLAARDFTLSGANLPAAGDSSIGSEFSLDMNGVTRGANGTWDKGAYEFGGSGGGDITPPAAPVGVTIQ